MFVSRAITAVMLFCAAAVFGEEATAPAEVDVETRLIQKAVEAIKAGARPRAFVDVAGTIVNAPAEDADEDGIWVNINDEQMAYHWRAFPSRRLCSFLSKVLPAGDAGLRLDLAKWAASRDLKEQAEAEIAAALQIDPKLAARAEEVRRMLAKPSTVGKETKVKKPKVRPAPKSTAAMNIPQGPPEPLGKYRIRKPILVQDMPDVTKLGPHPRLWVTSDKAKKNVPTVDVLRAKPNSPSEDPAAVALAYLLRGDASALKSTKEYLKTPVRGDAFMDVMQQVLAYDWVYSGLTPEERKTFAGVLIEAVNAVGNSQRDYIGPLNNNSLRWVFVSAMAALTIGSEDTRAAEIMKTCWPTIHGFLDYTADQIEDPSGERGYALLGGGWPEGFDYNRHGARYMLPLLHALRSATNIDGVTGSRFLHDEIYCLLYAALPGWKYRLGIEDDDHQSLLWHDRQIVAMCAGEFPDSHAGTYLKLNPDKYAHVFDLLRFVFCPPNLVERPLEELPTARHIQGIGLVTMRSDWTDNALFASFQCGDHFEYHENNAENAFTIFRKAPVALDTGIYNGQMHDHYVNYSIRTIAHNTVLVYDPGEKYSGARKAYNDGGQMILNWDGWTYVPNRDTWLKEKASFADKADMLDFETNPVYDYAAGEASRAYRRGKVQFFSRQMVLVKPDWIVVFDRVISGSPAHLKTWICHAQDGIQDLGGGKFVFTTSSGPQMMDGPMKMYVHSLMPSSQQGARYEIIGGPGKEYFYGGQNFGGIPPHDDQPGGSWRLEVQAPLTKETYFLHAMFVPQNPSIPSPPAAVEQDTPESVIVSLAGGAYRLAFAKQGPVEFQMLNK